MSDSRDLVLDFWKNKNTYIEKYGFAYSKEDIKVLLTEVKRQGALEEFRLLEKAVFDLENGKVGELINNPKFDYKYYIHERIKELKEGVEK
jgi:hypothetical protein